MPCDCYEFALSLAMTFEHHIQTLMNISRPVATDVTFM